MSWIEKLYHTYEQCVDNVLVNTGEHILMHLDHTTQNAQLEIVLDGTGAFRRALVVPKDDAPTVVPCTEKSVSRSGVSPVPHPLCDKLQYVAGDFRDKEGIPTKGFQKEEGQPHGYYKKELSAWAEKSDNPTLKAIQTYVQQGTLILDLMKAGILPADASGNLVREATKEEKLNFPIWSVLPAGQTPQDAFVRWRVEIPGKPDSGTWEDADLIADWQQYSQKQITTRSLCMVTGDKDIPVAVLHPAKLRHGADKAKIISANDGNGFTYRGRFVEPDGLEACSVSNAVTQKAHNALRWLLARQGYVTGSHAYVSWAVSGVDIPQPWEDTQKLIPSPIDAQSFMAGDDSMEEVASTQENTHTPDHTRDLGQAFAQALSRAIRGYSANLEHCDDVVVMGMASATPGRMSIILYREIESSEFLKRIKNWHLIHAWPQRVTIPDPKSKKSRDKKSAWHVFAPSPSSIAKAAYGQKVDASLHSATVERLLVCIVDDGAVPYDLVDTCLRRACNPVAYTHWEWEQTLGVACALYKGFCERNPTPEKRRSYSMTLEQGRTTRDYLYGRLLAIADYLEGKALQVAGEQRPTNAMRLMQRFADHPATTWRTIRLALPPYMERLNSKRPGQLAFLKDLLEAVHCSFASAEEFNDDRRLSGEFLLAYYCQLQALKYKKTDNLDSETKENSDEQPTA